VKFKDLSIEEFKALAEKQMDLREDRLTTTMNDYLDKRLMNVTVASLMYSDDDNPQTLERIRMLLRTLLSEVWMRGAQAGFNLAGREVHDILDEAKVTL
jgi:hypothetical protein